MTDLEQRMKELDELRPPDLWQSIQVRSGRPQTFIQRILSYFRLISAMQVAALALTLAAIIGAGVVVTNLGVQEISTATDPADTVNEDEKIDEANTGQTTNDSVGSGGRPSGSSGTGASSKGSRPGASVGAATLTGDPLDTFAFTHFSTEAAGSTIERIAGDRSDRRRLAQGVAPSWSRDGKRIAFASHYYQGGLRLINADGSDLRDLGITGAFPTWSPDGLRLTFNWPCDSPTWPTYASCWQYTETPRGYGCGPTECGIGVIGADGGGVRRLGNGIWPDWGPDGRIVFTDGTPTEPCQYGTAYWYDENKWYEEGGGAPSGDYESPYRLPNCALPLWVMNADGSDRTALPIAKATAPKWSPDGKRIAYHVETEGVFISNADGSGIMKVAPAGFMDPSWSPDGKRLALTRRTSDAFTWSTFVRAADGSGEIQLTFGDRDTLPSFSPRR